MATKREIFAANLRKYISQSHLNQTQLADICGVSKGSFSDWANGRSYPRPEKMGLLARALGVTEYDLTTDFGGDGKRSYMNKEVEEIANMLYKNPDARGLFTAIMDLSPEDKIAIKSLVYKLSQK